VSTPADKIQQAAVDLPELFPDSERQDTRRIADLAVEGVLLFYGRRAVKVGRRNIDWTGRHIEHQEWRAQLNRFRPLQPLRRAYRETGNEEYARCARDYIEDWIDQHDPYDMDNPVPPQRDNSLNMSVRTGGLRSPGWTGIIPDMLGSEAFDDKFIEKMLSSVQWQLEWLEKNLRPTANWRIASLDALLCNALRLPERFGKHLHFALEGFNIAFEGQILPDGVHIERSGGYHEWMCYLFVELWRLGQKRKDLGVSLDPVKIARMHSYSLHQLKPNAGMCGFNDCGSPYRTSDNSATDLGTRIEEHETLLRETDQDGELSKLAVFPDAGHVFYRTGWGTDDLWWAFDAAGWSRGGHAHLSRLSIELHNGRRTTLPDPGIFDYEMSNPMAPIGKGTPAHSTMNVNLANQSNVDGKLVRAVDLPTAVVIQGVYEGGYWPGEFRWNFDDGLGRGWFGWHDRTMVWLKDKAMIVLDCLEHDVSETAQLHWISDDVPVDLDGDGLGITTGDKEGNVRIRVCPITSCAAAGSVHRGEKDPYLGWVKSAGGVVAGPLFQVSFRSNSPKKTPVRTECTSVIVPFAGSRVPEFSVSSRTFDSVGREVKVTWGDGAVDRVVFARQLGYPVRNCGDVHSDSAMVLLHYPPGDTEAEIERLNGNFVRIGQSE
jgi:HAMP domain-containing protein